MEEYKILQSKIDKLGADMFMVRSWCITIFTGVVAGAKLSGSLTTPVVLLLLLVVIAFQLVENRQRQISRRSARRGYDIEVLLRRALRNTDQSTLLAPRLATVLLREGQQDRKFSHTLKRIAASFSSPIATPSPSGAKEASLDPEPSSPPSALQRLKRPCSAIWQGLTTHADILFYAVQYGIILCLLLSTSCSKAQTKDAEPRLSLQLGKDSFTIGLAKTNLLVTNYVTHTLETTNYVVHTRETTNFVVTVVYKTNYVTVSAPTNRPAGSAGTPRP